MSWDFNLFIKVYTHTHKKNSAIHFSNAMDVSLANDEILIEFFRECLQNKQESLKISKQPLTAFLERKCFLQTKGHITTYDFIHAYHKFLREFQINIHDLPREMYVDIFKQFNIVIKDGENNVIEPKYLVKKRQQTLEGVTLTTISNK